VTSVHTFDSYKDLTSFFTRYSARHGFVVRLRPKGGEDLEAHGGSARCWCYHPAPRTDELQPINPAAQRRKGVKVTAEGSVNCGCPWLVCWNRSGKGKEQWKWRITAKRKLVHNHELSRPLADNIIINSLRRVPDEVEQLLTVLIRGGVKGEFTLSRVIESHLSAVIDRPTFHNLINKVKSSLGFSTSEGEFERLLVWLVEEVEGQGAIARFSVSSSTEIDRVFYMSQDMVYNTVRNGCVLIMDSTHKTNRFDFPLLLICGVNEYAQTVLLAVALLHHQTIESFVWALKQLKAAFPAEGWRGIACVATDGDAAMDAAIEETLPHARHIRCWYHLEQNLRHNLLSVLDVPFDEFLRQWQAVAGSAEETDYQQRRADLHSSYPAAVPYLEANIWKNDQLFVRCYTKVALTLGILSTQRVEGMNAKLKGMLQVTSTTALPVLFASLRFAASDIDRKAIELMRKMDAEPQTEAYKDTIQATLHRSLSRWAKDKVLEQVAIMHNYRVIQEVREGRTVYVVHPNIRDDVRRTVKVTADTMECSCFFPTTYLLPCRHVLCLNQQLMMHPFSVGQVGQRWLRSFMPPSKYQPFISPTSYPSSSPSSQPCLPSYLANKVQGGAVAGRKRRFAELQGILTAVAHRAADDITAYPSIKTKAEELRDWVETETRVASVAPRSDEERALGDVTQRLTALNDTVTIGNAKAPLPVKKGKGRSASKRIESQGEKVRRKGGGKGKDKGEAKGSGEGKPSSTQP
jgi:hypothetical protein